MEADQVQLWARYHRCQALQELQRRHYYVGGTVAKQLLAAGLKGVTTSLQTNHADVQDVIDFATMHRAKGLEFDAVAVVAPKAYFGNVEGTANQRKLVYVALTRARRAAVHRLVLRWLGSPETAMSAKTKPAPKLQPRKEEPKALNVAQQPSESRADALARTSLRSTVQAALTLMDYNKSFGELSINTLVEDLGKQCEIASGGDLKRAEAILIAQAHTLDAIFHNLARRAQRVEYPNQLDTNMRLALKAQAQCRSTLEALAAIKNPQHVAFVKQANIAHGTQQVNNAGAADPSRAERSGNQPNKVLEHQHGERLDFGTAGAAISADSPMEAVGAVNRPEDANG